MREDSDRRRSRVWLIYLFAGILATGSYFLLPSASAQNILYNLVGFSSVGAIIVGTRTNRPTSPLHWYVLASGMLILNIGEVIFTFYENGLGIEAPFPSIADGFYLVAMLCFAAGLVVVHRRRVSGRHGADLIDALMVGTVAGMLSWICLMEPNVYNGTSSLFERLISISYPLMDLVVLVAVLQLWLASQKRLPAYDLLSASLVFLLIADTAYAATLVNGTYATGNPLDGGWLLFFALFGAAVLHPSMVTLSDPVVQAQTKLAWRRLVLLTGTLLIAPALLAYQAVIEDHIHVPLLAGGSVVLFLLVALRMGGMIGERQLFERRLEFRAFHDPLTGLPNRTLFMDRLERALARTERRTTKVAVLFVDLDDFKEVNDSFGHEAGDRVLVAVAHRLRGCLRPADTAARMGGDEFVVLVEDVEDALGAARLAERILDELGTPVSLEGLERVVGVSIGIALGGAQEGRPGNLLRKADLALYRAKSRGKAAYEVFVPDLEDKIKL
jgi:diguanylate cyclase